MFSAWLAQILARRRCATGRWANISAFESLFLLALKWRVSWSRRGRRSAKLLTAFDFARLAVLRRRSRRTCRAFGAHGRPSDWRGRAKLLATFAFARLAVLR